MDHIQIAGKYTDTEVESVQAGREDHAQFPARSADFPSAARSGRGSAKVERSNVDRSAQLVGGQFAVIGDLLGVL